MIHTSNTRFTRITEPHNTHTPMLHNNSHCEDCIFFSCAGYHTYWCDKHDESAQPFDEPCKDMEVVK